MDYRGSLAMKFCLCLVAVLVGATPVAAQTLSANPSALNVAYTAGAQAPEPADAVITASTGVTPVLTAALVSGGTAPAGLFVPTVSGVILSVGIDRGTLQSIETAAGLYTANIIVTAAGFPPLTVPITLSIG